MLKAVKNYHYNKKKKTLQQNIYIYIYIYIYVCVCVCNIYIFALGVWNKNNNICVVHAFKKKPWQLFFWDHQGRTFELSWLRWSGSIWGWQVTGRPFVTSAPGLNNARPHDVKTTCYWLCLQLSDVLNLPISRHVISMSLNPLKSTCLAKEISTDVDVKQAVTFYLY
jgi:hypothetical protein